jgi:hypothetical protein
MPFEKVEPEKIKSFDDYKDLAKQHLVATVEGYKKYSKSYVDHLQLVPEQYQGLVWFLFPSQVMSELVSLKKGTVTFERLKALSHDS